MPRLTRGQIRVVGYEEDVLSAIDREDRKDRVGVDAADAAKIALGVPLALAAGYGIYKAGSAISSTEPGKPWLYKLSPTYWLKGTKEREYVRTEREATAANKETTRDLAAAERAYKVTSALADRQARLADIDAKIHPERALTARAAPAQPALESTETPAPAISGENMEPGKNQKLDKQILKALTAAKIPIAARSFYGPEEMLRAGQIVGRIVGDKDAAESWLFRFVERQHISFGAPDGSTFEVLGGRKVMTAPATPGDVSLKTRATLSGAAPAPTNPAEAAFLNQVFLNHGAKMYGLAQRRGLLKKKQWSKNDVDAISADLLKQMMAATGGKAPNTTDANIARAAVRFFVTKGGGSIAGDYNYPGFAGLGADFVGLSWGLIPKLLTASPGAYATIWAAKKVGGGIASAARYVGQKLGIVSKPQSADQSRRSALAQMAQRKTAAAQRILAAQQKQDAASLAQQQAADLQKAREDAEAAEAAATAAEDVAAQTQATSNLSDEGADALAALGIPSVSGWQSASSLPPAMVGKGALAAATNTRTGRRLRLGAHVARLARRDPGIAAVVGCIMGAAASGDRKAKAQARTIRAGAIADSQRVQAFRTNASVASVRAYGKWRRLLKKAVRVGVSPIGALEGVRTPRSLVSVGADAPRKQTSPTKGPPASCSAYPPPIPGVPNDVIVAITAASNSLGVPPAVAASVVAAARSGDKKAQGELVSASRVYKAAQKGDPVAMRQMKGIAADMKTGYAPAAQKAAIMAAAVGSRKGAQNFERRKKARAAAMKTPMGPPPSPAQYFPDLPKPASYFRIISFGDGPLGKLA